jgi:hypothetical protein
MGTWSCADGGLPPFAEPVRARIPQNSADSNQVPAGYRLIEIQQCRVAPAHVRSALGFCDQVWGVHGPASSTALAGSL